MSEMQIWLQNLLDSIMIQEPVVEIVEEEEKVLVNIKVQEEDSGLLIGYRGETLSSIQRLLRIVFFDKYEEGEVFKKLFLNVNNYREDKEERLRISAVNAAEKIFERGGVYRMYGLNAADRYIVHDEISTNPDLSELESVSEGYGQDRTLVIRFKRENE